MQLLLDLDPDLPEFVEIDPTRLRQIVGNLVSNALKFTKDGEVVATASVRQYDDAEQRGIVEFSVKDSGISISDQAIGKLFSRFIHAKGSTTRFYGGTGLGLSICKELCELMGGTIGVVSEEGHGSTFTFSLPMPVLRPARSGDGSPLKAVVITASPTLKRIVSKGLEARKVACTWFEPTITLAKALEAEISKAERFDVIVVDQGKHISECVEIKRLVKTIPGGR
ncbi:ATP-binding protein [Consotaella aegiceratis]|uniref:ATP-binding protein n=1 Tax=Consotaella aegiceratis TaxID=3097961 RepID=UPI002F3F0174